MTIHDPISVAVQHDDVDVDAAWARLVLSAYTAASGTEPFGREVAMLLAADTPGRLKMAVRHGAQLQNPKQGPLWLSRVFNMIAPRQPTLAPELLQMALDNGLLPDAVFNDSAVHVYQNKKLLSMVLSCGANPFGPDTPTPHPQTVFGSCIQKKRWTAAELMLTNSLSPLSTQLAAGFADQLCAAPVSPKVKRLAQILQDKAHDNLSPKAQSCFSQWLKPEDLVVPVPPTAFTDAVAATTAPHVSKMPLAEANTILAKSTPTEKHVRRALFAGGDPNTRDEAGRTLIWRGAQRSSAAVIALALAHGADAQEIHPKNKMSLLHLTCHIGPGSSELIAAGAPVNVQNDKGDTPLHVAALSGDAKLCDLLCRAGANPNTPNHHGLSPLHCASQSSRNRCGALGSDVVRVLLTHGADPTQTTLSGATPYDHWLASKQAPSHLATWPASSDVDRELVGLLLLDAQTVWQAQIITQAIHSTPDPEKQKTIKIKRM